ncbi:Brain protein I3-like 4, partial [Homarus americanus]
MIRVQQVISRRIVNVTVQPLLGHTRCVGGPITHFACRQQQRQKQRGNCPNCRRGNLRWVFTRLGIFAAIFLFPLGLMVLFCQQKQLCPMCRYEHGRNWFAGA